MSRIPGASRVGSAIGARIGSAIGDMCKPKCAQATPENIQAVLQSSSMRTLQGSVSASAIQGMVNTIQSGGSLPPIQVDGNVIVEGNHRYIAGLLCAMPVPMQPWTAPLTKPSIPVRNLQITP
jgi:hypothetical protein